MTARPFVLHLLAAAASLALASGAMAQRPALDAQFGVDRRWVVTPNADAAVLVLPSVTFERRGWRAEGGASTDMTSVRASRTRFAFSGSALGPRIGPFRTEVEAAYLTPIVLDPSANVRTSLRFHLSGPTRGLWLGAGQARIGSAGTVLASTGAWWSGPIGTFSLRFDDALGGARSRTSFESDTLVIRESLPAIQARSAVARFVRPDGRVELSVAMSRLEAPGAHGRRGAGAGGTWWFTPTVAFTGSYGVPMEGAVVGSRAVARFGILFRHRPVLPRPSTLIERPMAEVARLNDQQWRIRIPAPGAGRVELQGSPTEWEPVALAKGNGGWWEVTLTLPPGRHEIIWRRDGGEWQTLPGLPTATDPDLGDVTVVVTGE